MFVPTAIISPPHDFKGHTLVIPTHCIGLSSYIALDLYILNEGLVKVGYFKIINLAPGVSNDGLSLNENEGNLILPCEIYSSNERKITFLMMRGGPVHGKMQKLADDISKFARLSGFTNLIILTASMTPVRRDRDSNRK
jgi:predicted ATP-grasp superfamily ATP-dependent carboligase